jgi:hypothetical protein
MTCRRSNANKLLPTRPRLGVTGDWTRSFN